MYCEQLAIEDSQDDLQLNLVSGCVAACMTENWTENILSNCYDECSHANLTDTKQTESYGNETVRLVCREADSLIIEIVDYSMDKQEFNHSIVLLKIQANNIEPVQRIVYIADDRMVKIENLQKNTSYTVVGGIFSVDNLQYRQFKSVNSFDTLPSTDYIPQMIQSDSIRLNFTWQNNSLRTLIQWKPTDDQICNYFYHLYATQDEDYTTAFEQNYRKLTPNELYHLTIDTLKMETEYMLDIHGTNAVDPSIEGQRSDFEFITPICWEIFNVDSNHCRPQPLENIESVYEWIATDTYRINVTWDLPKMLPDFHVITLNMYANKGNGTSQNVTGHSTFASFPQVKLTGNSYDIEIVSYSKGGYTINPMMDFKFIPNNFMAFLYIWIAISVVLAAILLLSIWIVLVIICRRSKCDVDLELAKINDEMEIDPADVKLSDVKLGEGAFGCVYLGMLKKSMVAVKTIKDDSADSVDTKRNFLTEIIVMKSVKHHENILKIVGHSTKIKNKLMLITEYCDEGNLLQYLIKLRDPLSTSSSNIKMENVIWNESYVHETAFMLKMNCDDKIGLVENPGYDLMPSHEFNRSTEKPHIGRELLDFAKQIANGMEFLATEKIVHRDLAARNVLVCSNQTNQNRKTIKISDFGLSRDIYYDNVYIKQSPGRLPIKWMALESIKCQVYTIESDVWAYGILLYEIATLGDAPYPEVGVDFLKEYLESGKRMEKPLSCGPDFYDLMHRCWNAEPEKRPTFKEILQKLKQIDYLQLPK